MRRVIIESPYASTTEQDIRNNIAYARACMKDSLSRGESPIAMHLLHTQDGICDDQIPEQRTRSLLVGFEWTKVADAVVVYTDFGISIGMQHGIESGKSAGVVIEYRTLEGSKH